MAFCRIFKFLLIENRQYNVRVEVSQCEAPIKNSLILRFGFIPIQQKYFGHSNYILWNAFDVSFKSTLTRNKKMAQNKRIVSFCLHLYWPIRDLHSFALLACLEETLIHSKIFLKEDGKEMIIFLKSQSIDPKEFLIFLLLCTFFSTPDVELPKMSKRGSFSQYQKMDHATLITFKSVSLL